MHRLAVAARGDQAGGTQAGEIARQIGLAHAGALLDLADRALAIHQLARDQQAARIGEQLEQAAHLPGARAQLGDVDAGGRGGLVRRQCVGPVHIGVLAFGPCVMQSLLRFVLTYIIYQN